MNAVKVCKILAVLLVLGGISSALYGRLNLQSRSAVGGPGASNVNIALEAESSVRSLRAKKAVLQRREEILRYQLRTLEEERSRTSTSINPKLREELRKSRNMLVLLLRDQQENDSQVTDYLKQMWEAEGRVRVLTMGTNPDNAAIIVSWPVLPEEGISAVFQDAEYEEIFGIEHNAIDIPIEQNSEVHAAASGEVEAVVDNGMGYNYLILKHSGYVTLYGHLLSFAVEEGQEVAEGQVIGYTGGQKGTPGAGQISTGPHLHFEIIAGGEHRDPLPYLPFMAELKIAGRDS
tara:strand:- start:332 stop:1204 length:873 start_codon:yes stop_codon:yes gene_type:complete